MRAVVQRVSSASVEVDGNSVSSIGKGLLVLVGVIQGDKLEDAHYLATKMLGLRIFSDENEKMNLDVSQAGGSILLVSQFTLAGDARKGNRPDFGISAKPENAIELLDEIIARIRNAEIPVCTGVFGAHMKVSLVNDGPVTILLDSRRLF